MKRIWQTVHLHILAHVHVWMLFNPGLCCFGGSPHIQLAASFKTEGGELDALMRWASTRTVLWGFGLRTIFRSADFSQALKAQDAFQGAWRRSCRCHLSQTQQLQFDIEPKRSQKS